MKDLTSPSIAILGLGAIGTLLAFHWRNHSPFCISRNRDNCQRQITDLQQQSHQLQLEYWDHQSVDWLVVTTKASDTLAALKPLQTKLHVVKRVLLLQNGMGQQQEVADWLSQQPQSPELWAGISTEGAYRSNPEQVVYAGAGETVIGRWNSDQKKQPDSQLNNTQIVSDIRQRITAKLAINAVINPLTAIHRCRNGELVTNPEYHQQLQKLAVETQQFFQKQGWLLPFDLKQRAAEVATATGNNRSSTLQDVLNHQPTELAYINGYLWRLAQQQQYPLPITRQILEELGEI